VDLRKNKVYPPKSSEEEVEAGSGFRCTFAGYELPRNQSKKGDP
jgi:hypothetical protein